MAAIAPFGLRMQPELKARIEAAAQENNRSMNAEIVSRLESSFTKNSLISAIYGESEASLDLARDIVSTVISAERLGHKISIEIDPVFKGSKKRNKPEE